MTSLLKLKQTEYKTGANLAFNNFEDLFETSKKAAEIGNYGISSSLCVLAIEELTKAIILHLKSINNLIPIVDLEKYFWNHEIKHNAGIDLYFQLTSKHEKKQFSSKNKDFNNTLGILILIIILAFINHIQKKEIGKRKKEKSYFDSIKESGLYVSYNSSMRKWDSPNSKHDKKSYDSIYQLTDNFSNKVKDWFFDKKINKDNIFEFASKLDDKIINKKQLEKLREKL